MLESLTDEMHKFSELTSAKKHYNTKNQFKKKGRYTRLEIHGPNFVIFLFQYDNNFLTHL